MSVRKNIIGRQIVHFQYHGKADGLALQKEVSDWCSLKLIPEIEQELDLLSFNDEYITIDKLELDAVVDSKDWQQRIKTDILTTLKQKLEDRMLTAEKKHDKQNSIDYKIDELILFYFENGRMPWWADTLIEDDFKKTLNRWINEEKNQHRINEIKRRMQSIVSISVAERIINDTYGEELFSLLRNIFASDSALINSVEFFSSDVWKTKPSIILKKAVLKPMYQYLLVSLLRNENVLKLNTLMEMFLYHVNKQSAYNLINTSLPLQQPYIDNAWKDVVIKDKTDSEKHNDNYNKLFDKMKAEKETIFHKDLDEGIFIENAGAIIIAPFLTTLFTKTGISENGKIMDTAAAIACIQHAVTGETTFAEHQFVLPKLLCGLDIELPISSDLELTFMQKTQVSEMLKSVIEHWAILGNTTVDGLRESFLKRTGKLTFNDDGWLLQVEQRPFDMLLQQLPWNMSMIKLPWMEKLLRTEWV
jgi:hypothetical protein